jgi:hypothetical protein
MSARSRLLAAAAAATASMALLAALRPRLLRRACRALSTCASLSSLPLGARVPPPSPPAAVPPSPVRVALCQLAGSKDKQANIAGACQAVRDAAAAGAQLVVLPEMWNCPYGTCNTRGCLRSHVPERGYFLRLTLTHVQKMLPSRFTLRT